MSKREEDAPKQNQAFVHMDIANRNKRNVDNATPEQKSLADDFWSDVVAAYDAQTYRNYRVTCISIKVEKPRPIDKHSVIVTKLNAQAEKLGINVKERRGHVYYEIPLA